MWSLFVFCTSEKSSSCYIFSGATSAQELHQKIEDFEPGVQVLEMLYGASDAK